RHVQPNFRIDSVTREVPNHQRRKPRRSVVHNPHIFTERPVRSPPADPRGVSVDELLDAPERPRREIARSASHLARDPLGLLDYNPLLFFGRHQTVELQRYRLRSLAPNLTRCVTLAPSRRVRALLRSFAAVSVRRLFCDPVGNLLSYFACAAPGPHEKHRR